ncbi:hypothetical protein ASA1KI_45260 [Opitutales bacterium ASA1]|uniref:IS66 family insertion sequence element accessory protein TnpA n=1 Tax=Congregicoccus parvus TaxID=3081749 RepID=UPI002B2CEEEE|nr:hypothetical protein ASA1KI_29460 [Opitutales bacterium ASA1]BET69608.1 hypothetical protein ASA1KI_45260 [Opitutales bacterium ASA1]
MQTTELVEEEIRSGGGGRRRYGRSAIERYLREYDASGLTQSAFAKRAGVQYQTFASWVRARRLRGSASSSPVRFVEAALPASAVSASGAEVSVQLTDGTLIRGNNAAVLIAVVAALRARSC